MNGVEVRCQRPLEFVAEADVVLMGSGIRTRDVVADDTLLERLPLDPLRHEKAARAAVEYAAPVGEKQEVLRPPMSVGHRPGPAHRRQFYGHP